MFSQIKIISLKLILKILGLIFNRTEDINKKLKEMDSMKAQGRIILPEDLDHKIYNDFTMITNDIPTKEQFIDLKQKIQFTLDKTGYYPSRKQIEFYIATLKAS